MKAHSPYLSYILFILTSVLIIDYSFDAIYIYNLNDNLAWHFFIGFLVGLCWLVWCVSLVVFIRQIRMLLRYL